MKTVNITESEFTRGLTLSEIQKEQHAWQLKNFGAQPRERMLLGIIEEFGEMSQWLREIDVIKEEVIGVPLNREEFEDGMGDMLVYMCAYATKQGWDIDELYSSAPEASRDYVELTIALGVLCHCELKTLQNIRGTHVELKDKAKVAFVSVLAELSGMAELLETHPRVILNKVWAKVSQRDWKKDPKKGGDT